MIDTQDRADIVSAIEFMMRRGGCRTQDCLVRYQDLLVKVLATPTDVELPFKKEKDV